MVSVVLRQSLDPAGRSDALDEVLLWTFALGIRMSRR